MKYQVCNLGARQLHRELKKPTPFSLCQSKDTIRMLAIVCFQVSYTAVPHPPPPQYRYDTDKLKNIIDTVSMLDLYIQAFVQHLHRNTKRKKNTGMEGDGTAKHVRCDNTQKFDISMYRNVRYDIPTQKCNTKVQHKSTTQKYSTALSVSSRAPRHAPAARSPPPRR